MTTLGDLRARLAVELRRRVAGEDAAQKAEQIWGAAGPRRFLPEDAIWRVHQDAAMFVGGIRALLVQSMHPLAMAAVAGHSGYRGDPWGRLARTSQFLATTTFGTDEHASEVIGHVRSIHARIQGVTADGQAYRASDPHLLRWVFVAEADSFLAAHQKFSKDRLTRGELDDYVRQAGVVAGELGASDLPNTYAELKKYLRSYRGELRGTKAARDAARFLLLTPPLPLPARPGYSLLAAGGVAITPGWVRRGLRLPPAGLWDGAGRVSGQVGVSAVRWAMADPAVAH